MGIRLSVSWWNLVWLRCLLFWRSFNLELLSKPLYGSYNEEQKEENASVFFISVSRRLENFNTPAKSRKRDLLSVYVVLINIWTYRWSKYREWKIYCSVLTLSFKPQIWKCHLFIWQLRQRIVLKTCRTCNTMPLPLSLRKLANVIAWMRENNRATRAARTFWNFRAVIYKATTWNNYILAPDDNLSLQ